MQEYLTFEISFPDVDFDKFIPIDAKVAHTHQAYLFTDENEIEIRIFFKSETYFGEKLSRWFSKINWRSFGSFISVDKVNENLRVLDIDFKNSALITARNSTTQFENGFQYIRIFVSSVKSYWEPSKEKKNTGEFYFNEPGFTLVSDYYTTLGGWDGKFSIDRMNGMDEFYKIGKAEFRPELHFSYSDQRNKKEVIITKEPKLQFHYEKSVTEEEAIIYAETIRLLASFYFHNEMAFLVQKIYLTEYSIIIKKIQKKDSKDEGFANLWGMKNYWSFHELMQSNWQSKTRENFMKLSKAIELFNYSHTLDKNSKFLIRFNIIELCSSKISKNPIKFQSILNDKEQKKVYNKARDLILQTIHSTEQKDFLKKWEILSDKIKYKPMKSPLIQFFQNQNLDPKEFPISVNELMKIRNNLTHGSISKINNDQLDKANSLLYRIGGILILNLMGISEWKLDKNIK